MARSRSCAVLLALACLGLPPADGMLQAFSLRLGGVRAGEEVNWEFFAKFSYGIGTSRYKYRLRLEGPLHGMFKPSQNVTVLAEHYFDEHWPAVLSIPEKCARKDKAQGTRELSIPPDGSWTEWSGGTVEHVVRSHVWYYTLSSCQASLGRVHKIGFEFEALQPNGSHFSVEHQWTLPANIISLIFMAVFSCILVQRCRDFARSAGAMHMVMWVLAGIVAVQFIAQALHAVHLVGYSRNGQGVKALEILSEMLTISGQMVEATFLIIIGTGYTLQSEGLQLDWVIPVGGLIIIIHVCVIALSRQLDGAADKFHSHDGFAGLIILGLRMLLYAWFLWAVRQTKRKSSPRLKAFLEQFRMAGSLYFLSYPMLYLIASLFAPYLRPAILTVGLMILQIASNVWLSNLLLSRGEYFKVSEMSESELPGASSGGRVRKSD